MSRWPTVALADIVRFDCGGTPSKGNPEFWNGDIPWISPKDMGGTRVDDAEDRISEAAVTGSATRIVDADATLVVVRSGILVRRFPVCRVNGRVAFNQDIKALRPKTRKLNPNYLAAYLRGRENHVLQAGVKKGATVHSIASGFLEQLQIPFPSLDEQRVIVDRLDAAAEIRRRAQAARDKARALTQALFLDMFGDPATNPKGWPVVGFNSLVDTFAYGTNQKCHDKMDGSIPVLRIPNVIGGTIDHTDLKYAQMSERDVQKYALHTGDLLFVRTNGNPNYIGRCAEFKAPQVIAFASYLIRARLDTVVISPMFLSELFNHPSYRPIMLKTAQTTAGNYNLSIDGLGGLTVVQPPLSLQTRFSEAVTSVTAVMRRLDESVIKAEAAAAALSAEVFG